jgi:malate dehydrogenase (oxaloacetate-decarboxylating)
MSANANPVFRLALRGDAILSKPRWNKGTAFTLAERKAFGLSGRLPIRVNTLDEQCQRAYDQLRGNDSPLRQNGFLQSLKEQNLVLYYALLSRHLKELIPIIYTPTEVGFPIRCIHLTTNSSVRQMLL